MLRSKEEWKKNLQKTFQDSRFAQERATGVLCYRGKSLYRINQLANVARHHFPSTVRFFGAANVHDWSNDLFFFRAQAATNVKSDLACFAPFAQGRVANASEKGDSHTLCQSKIGMLNGGVPNWPTKSFLNSLPPGVDRQDAADGTTVAVTEQSRELRQSRFAGQSAR